MKFIEDKRFDYWARADARARFILAHASFVFDADADTATATATSTATTTVAVVPGFSQYIKKHSATNPTAGHYPDAG